MRLPVDLRSDTVTLPPPGMRAAMARAEVGDDGYGEDPTTRRLEAVAAERLGKEAALFVASGTMANLLASMVHCPRGARALLGDLSDIWRWEGRGASTFGGVAYEPLPTQADGTIALSDLHRALDDTDPDDGQCAPAALVCIEDSHCMRGGRVLPLDYLDEVGRFAASRGLSAHLDGARLFNAAAASGVEAGRIARAFDSVCVCLSKGLAAPAGSLLAGSAAFVERARRLRKMLGGTMRQTGFLAAAGLFALEEMRDRLTEDHASARRLAEGWRGLTGLRLETDRPETNIVFLSVSESGHTPRSFLRALAQKGVRMLELGAGRLRAVTHYGIGSEEIERAVEAVALALAQPPATRFVDRAAS